MMAETDRTPAGRLPSWLRRRFEGGRVRNEVRALLRDLDLHTVCEGARCPNLCECWQRRAATFLLLGDTCTRNCAFCAVKHGQIAPPDPAEPAHIVEAVSRLELRFVVLTCVTRDDLRDGGAHHIASVIAALRRTHPEVGVEVLPSDLQGQVVDVETILRSGPDVFNHNIETVERLTPLVRDRADYRRSLSVLRFASTFAAAEGHVRVKSGIMLGLAAVVLLPVGGVAQCDDDKLQKASEGGSGYRKIDDTLCEGIYGKDVSGDVLTFVSLTEANSLYFETYEPLQIAWDIPEGIVHLRAQSWAEQAFQMDARIAEAGNVSWPVDLLQTESIPLAQVGLLGWIEAGENKLYAPLRVSHEPDPEPDPDYVIQILPNARLNAVSVTLASVGAAGERPSGSYLWNERVLKQTSFTMAEAFEIWIPRSELPSSGVYFMEISAMQVDDTTPDTVTLWFHHSD